MRSGWMGVVLGLLMLMIGIARAADGPEAVDARLETFFRDYLEGGFKLQPLMATKLGDHRFDDKLDDLSADARAARVARDRKALADLSKQFDPGKLSRDGRINLAILRHSLEYAIWHAERFKPFEDDPRVYGDYLTESVYLLFTQSTLPKDVNLKNALARMALVPKVVEVARKTIKNPPRVKTETAIRQTKGAISFYDAEVFTLAGLPKGQGELGERARAIVEALGRHLKFLQEEVLPRSTEDWRAGRELFAEKLDRELDSGISADEVLKEAESEAVRVEHEMAVIARQLWATTFSDEVIPPDDDAGRRLMTRGSSRRSRAGTARPKGSSTTPGGPSARSRRSSAARRSWRFPSPTSARSSPCRSSCEATRSPT